MAAEINQLNSTQNKALKRVLFVITQSEMGGAQRFLFSFLAGLDRSKYLIKVIVGADGDGELVKRLNELNIQTFTATRLRRNFNFTSDIASIFELRREVIKFKPDTLFLCSSKAGFVGSLACVFPKRIDQIKVIYRIGGWTFNDPWSHVVKKIWLVLERTSANWKDIIIVNNIGDLRQADELRIIPRDRVTLIHNGVDPYKINFLDKDAAKAEILSRAGLTGQNKKIVGTIANLYPAKGIESLVKSARYFSSADNVIIVIIGQGPQKQVLDKMIIEDNLKDRVFILGHISDARNYLPAFDAFVLPSLKEGFPWALIEAMSAHVPVVSTLVGAAVEIIDDGRNGFLIPPKRPDLIASKVKEIFQNENLRKEFIIQGHQTVLFKYSADKMIKSTEALL